MSYYASNSTILSVILQAGLAIQETPGGTSQAGLVVQTTPEAAIPAKFESLIIGRRISASLHESERKMVNQRLKNAAGLALSELERMMLSRGLSIDISGPIQIELQELSEQEKYNAYGALYELEGLMLEVSQQLHDPELHLLELESKRLQWWDKILPPEVM